jgi:arylsulfatase A-like enzyme
VPEWYAVGDEDGFHHRMRNVLTRRGALGFALVCTMANLGSACWRRSPAPAPYVFLISMDTFRWDALGALAGRGSSVTPNLDSVAADSVLFTRAFAQMPFTLPSHMSMITGVYPGVHDVTTKNDSLGPNVSTLAELLRGHRYSTFALVTSHWLKEGFGFGRGFDHFRQLLETTPANEVNRVAQELVEEQIAESSPGFFLLHYYDPHSDWSHQENKLPYYSPPRYRRDLPVAFCDENDRCSSDFLRAANETKRPMSRDEIDDLLRLYLAGVRAFDEDMGRFFTFLRNNGLYDRSLIIITSDHGEEFREHGQFIHSQTYDETIAVPLLVKFPRNQHSGMVVDDRLVESIDLLPTVLDYLGISGPPQVQGRSLLPGLRGEESGKEFALSQDQDRRSRFALRGARYKLIFDYESQQAELYDLEADPGERVNLGERQPGRVDEMLSSLTRRIEDNDLLRRALAAEGTNETNVLGEEEMERLRSLGYLP